MRKPRCTLFVVAIFSAFGFVACGGGGDSQECSPNTSVCVNDFAYNYCNADGKWSDAPSSCPNSMRCVRDRCVASADTTDGDADTQPSICGTSCDILVHTTKCHGEDLCTCVANQWKVTSCESFCERMGKGVIGCDYNSNESAYACHCEEDNEPDGDIDYDTDKDTQPAVDGDSDTQTDSAKIVGHCATLSASKCEMMCIEYSKVYIDYSSIDTLCGRDDERWASGPCSRLGAVASCDCSGASGRSALNAVYRNCAGEEEWYLPPYQESCGQKNDNETKCTYKAY